MSLRDKIKAIYDLAVQKEELAQRLREESKRDYVVFELDDDWDTALSNYISTKEVLEAVKAEYESVSKELEYNLTEIRDILDRASINTAVFELENGKIQIMTYEYPFYKLLNGREGQ